MKGGGQRLSRMPLCVSVVPQKERGGRSCADEIHQQGIGDEVGENHERQAAEHELPQMHALAVDKGNKSNRAEQEIADQICDAQADHRPSYSLSQANLRCVRRAPHLILNFNDWHNGRCKN